MNCVVTCHCDSGCRFAAAEDCPRNEDRFILDDLRKRLTAAEDRVRKAEEERDDMNRAMLDTRRRRNEVMYERDYWMNLPRNRKFADARADTLKEGIIEGARSIMDWLGASCKLTTCVLTPESRETVVQEFINARYLAESGK